jgi:hypothetical protein
VRNTSGIPVYSKEYTFPISFLFRSFKYMLVYVKHISCITPRALHTFSLHDVYDVKPSKPNDAYACGQPKENSTKTPQQISLLCAELTARRQMNAARWRAGGPLAQLTSRDNCQGKWWPSKTKPATVSHCSPQIPLKPQPAAFIKCSAYVHSHCLAFHTYIYPTIHSIQRYIKFIKDLLT